MKNISLLLILVVSTAFVYHSGIAGGPLYTFNGKSVVYKTMPVHYMVDKGPLGSFTSAEATNLTVSAFQVWQDVPTATVSFVNDGYLPVDVNGSNFTQYTNATDFVIDGISPIIFDSDGAITDSIWGDGANQEVIGFAGSAYSDIGTNAGYFIEGESVMNGLFTTRTYDPTHWTFTLEEFESTFVHEFGHFIGLDHTQINGKFAADSAHTKYIPTMFPTSTNNDADLATLNPDDIIAISQLYPEPGFLASRGGISGTVTRRNRSIVQGANVLAIDNTDTLMNVYSTVTDYFMAGNGNYSFQGMPAGSYWIKIEPIDQDFIGGSGVGPFSYDSTDISFINPVLPEYYNGASESGDPAIDNPDHRTPILVPIGSTTGPINLIANGAINNSIFTEDFSYVSASLLTNNGWAAHSGGGTNAIAVVTPGLQFIGYSGSGIGNAALLVATGEDDNRTFTTITSGDVYASFLVNVSSVKSSGDYFFHLSQNPLNTSHFLGRVYVKGSSSSIAFGLSKATDTVAYTSPVYSTNTTYLLVLKYSFSAATPTDDPVRLYVISGSIPSSEPATATLGPITGTATDANGIGSVALRQGNASNGPTLTIDAIRVNTDWIGTATDVAERITEELPRSSSLSQNFPNPFNPVTNVEFRMKNEGKVRLTVFDLLGRELATLVDGIYSAGTHKAVFNASTYPSGIYFYRLSVNGTMVETRRMVLLK